MKSASALNLLLGSWLLASSTMLGVSGAEAANCAVSGCLVMIAAVWSLLASRTSYTPARINFSIGLWSFISPWFLAGYTGDGFALLNSMFVGAFVIVLALARGIPVTAGGQTDPPSCT